jgi:hypothetical protein
MESNQEIQGMDFVAAKRCVQRLPECLKIVLLEVGLASILTVILPSCLSRRIDR